MKMIITSLILNEITKKKIEKKYKSYHYPNIQIIYGFQASYGCTRPGNSMNSEKPIKIAIVEDTKIAPKCIKVFPFSNIHLVQP